MSEENGKEIPLTIEEFLFRHPELKIHVQRGFSGSIKDKDLKLVRGEWSRRLQEWLGRAPR